ncbi:replicative DNA helicase [Paenibacillus sp. BIHB 4019]|nr:replicative DNA helicase [Paenibacillus sp. BIHB 4019]
MPVDIQAEQSVLGAILVDADAYDTVSAQLVGGEFSDIAHARIYRAMTRIKEASPPIPLDLVSLTSYLQDSEEIDSIGGVSYLSRLSAAVPTAANVGFYTDRVEEMFKRRQAIETMSELSEQAANSDDFSGFIEKAEVSFSKLSDQALGSKGMSKIKDVLFKVVDETEHLYNNRYINKGVIGVRSCFTDLDNMTAGFHDGDLIIIAARPSMGKTALALNIGQNVGIRTGESVAIFSLEMSEGQLVRRMICAEGNIDANRMRTGLFEGDDWEKITNAVSKLAEADIYIDDTPGITVNEIRSKCRRLKREGKLGLILIDYLQLISGNGRGNNRQEEVAHISRTLKQLARELEVPVIALSQLSRGVEQRQDKRPLMSDLRESGSIEQDADIVAFLYRDDYYDKESEKKNIIEIILAKQRNGPIGTVELIFLKNFNKFVNMDRSHEELPKGPPPTGNGVPDMYRRGA